MKKTASAPGILPAVTRRLVWLVLLLWLPAMILLTWTVAGDFEFQLDRNAEQYLSLTRHRSAYADRQELPGAAEYGMIFSLRTPYWYCSPRSPMPLMLPAQPDSLGSDDFLWGKWDLLYGYECAVVFLDSRGEPLIRSGNYLTFTCFPDGPDSQALGYVDLDALTDGEAAVQVLSDRGLGFVGLMPLLTSDIQMTGWFSGQEFHPVSLSLGGENLLPEQPVPPGQEVHPLYAQDYAVCTWNGAPVVWEGKHYENLSCLASQETYGQAGNLFSRTRIYSRQTSDAWGEYTVVLAIRSWSLGYALLRLIPVYLATLAAGILALLLIRRSIRRRLAQPLADTLWGSIPDTAVTPWKEAGDITGQIAAYRQSTADSAARIQQLETALEYAKDAEENRRTMVSALTHELKTPLAVIHSYAEGLAADIAPEQTDAYTRVILEEAERMDVMVLEMLDLSRLEAGKVRLNTSEFSPAALMRSVVSRLEPAAAERQLSVRFDAEEQFLLTADEARLRQVCTNLMTNAIRYSPPGGDIRIRITRSSQWATLSVSNGGTIPPDSLEKIFEPFVRLDPARSLRGSGLGLAIVRSIVQLHGGTCTAHNYRLDGEPMVEFRVKLPIA